MLTNMLNNPIHQLPTLELANPSSYPVHKNTLSEEIHHNDRTQVSQPANQVLSPPTSVEYVEESPTNSIKLIPEMVSTNFVQKCSRKQKHPMVHSLSAEERGVGPVYVSTVSDGKTRKFSNTSGQVVVTKTLSAPQLDDISLSSTSPRRKDSKHKIFAHVHNAQDTEKCSVSNECVQKNSKKFPRLQILKSGFASRIARMNPWEDTKTTALACHQNSIDGEIDGDQLEPELEDTFTTCKSTLCTPNKCYATLQDCASTDKCSLLHSVPRHSYCTFASNASNRYDRKNCMRNTHRCSLPLHPRDFIRDEDLFLQNDSVFLHSNSEHVEEYGIEFGTDPLVKDSTSGQSSSKIVTIPVVHVQPASDSSSPNMSLALPANISASNHSLHNYSTPSNSPTHSFHSCFSVNPSGQEVSDYGLETRALQKDLATTALSDNAQPDSKLNRAKESPIHKHQYCNTAVMADRQDHSEYEDVVKAEADYLTQQILHDAVKTVMKKPSKNRLKKSVLKIERSHSESALFNGEQRDDGSDTRQRVRSRGSISLLTAGMRIIHKVKSDTGLNCYVNLGYSESTYL